MPTIQSMVDAAPSGGTIIVPAGTYPEGVTVNKPLTLKAGGMVYIKSPPGMAGIRIAANYVTVDGLINGVPSFDIVATRDDGIEGNNVHHVTIRGVVAHHCGESGIQFNWSEFLTVEKNITYRNGRLSWYSGISVYQCREIGGAGPEPRTIVRDNISYENWTGTTGAQTDGNGIIIDDMNSTQNSGFPAWKHQTLVENNVCLFNGSKGIAVAWSDFTTVRRNTAYGNNGDAGNTATWRGDISVQSSRDCKVENNIAVCDPTTHASSTALGSYGGENIRNTWTGNIVWPAARAVKTEGGTGATIPASGYTVVNPLMPGQTKPNTKPSQGDGTVTYTEDWTFAASDWVPAASAAASAGWRPNGVVTPPNPEPEPLPDAPNDLSPFAAMAPTNIITENAPYEVGTKFTVNKDGKITALRLYRVNADAQPVRLWKGTTKVAEGTIPGGTGWSEFAVDIPAAVGDTFIVSAGKTAAQKYAADSLLSSAVAGDGFTIPAQGGVYATTIGTLPSLVYQDSYYWVDVRFAETVVTPEPDMDELIARVGDLEALVASMAADYDPRLSALGERMATAEAGLADLNTRLAAVEEASVPDLSGIQEELARLDGRLDAISGGAAD